MGVDGQPGVLSVFTGGTSSAGAEQILEIVAAAKAAQHGNFGDGVICHQQHLGGLAQPDVIPIFITVIATFGTVISSSLVAYALSRVRFRGRKFWFTCMLVTMMLPTQVIMIPQYLIYYRLGLVPGYVPLILPYFCGQAFFIYQMMQFMQGIPKDLDEAATIDGCSKYQIYSRIILPLMKPSIVTTVIIQFYWKWDDYMGPLLYLSRPQSYTVSIAIKLFADSASTTDYGAMFAMSTLSLIPVFLIFLFFNRYLVQGIGTSGLKG